MTTKNIIRGKGKAVPIDEYVSRARIFKVGSFRPRMYSNVVNVVQTM